MKLPRTILYAFLVCAFSSFGPTQACEYAGSNINYVARETKIALKKKDLQVMRFHIYKALDAISKSDKQLADCNCEHAIESLGEVNNLLKSAVKAKSLGGTRTLLEKTVLHVSEALEAIQNHEQHNSPYGTDQLTVNAPHRSAQNILPEPPNRRILEQKIDTALKKYEISLQKVINTINCKEARAFAMAIYEKCEKQLLRADLSEGKKYYNLRTKEITDNALDTLGDCRGK